MRTAVITVAHGRHAHWQNQRAALTRSGDADLHVLVAIEDPALGGDEADPPLRTVRLDRGPEGLPLARARNVGAATALAAGAELLIFLDVDCIPGPDLIQGFRAAASAPASRGRLLCGPVTYLDPPGPGGYDLARLTALDRPHPARPAPPPGQTMLGGSHELFWSLSFAVDAATWQRIGGFDERYSGYGGEDTDFGQRAREAGVELAWAGDARAYHQYHPVDDPPVSHLDDILRNGARFAERWGWWPMRGWLEEFERSGLVQWDERIGFRRAGEPIAPSIRGGS